VSTEIAGWPAAMAAFTVALMCANCASRSGCSPPSRAFWLAWQLYLRSRSRFATTRWLAWKPCADSALTRWRGLRLTQRSGEHGSPRMASPISASSAAGRPGWRATALLRPPPLRRTRPPIGLCPDRSSLIPRLMVLRATPVAAATAVTPPRPCPSASFAVNRALAAIRSSRFYAWDETVRSRLLIPRVPAAGKPAVAAGWLARAVHPPDLAERPAVGGRRQSWRRASEPSRRRCVFLAVSRTTIFQSTMVCSTRLYGRRVPSQAGCCACWSALS
jgi:hypothetical protein